MSSNAAKHTAGAEGCGPGFHPRTAGSATFGRMSASGFNVGKFLGLTAALAVGAGVGVGGYYGVRAASSNTGDAEPEADAEPTVEPEPELKLDIPSEPKRDIPPVDEPSDPNHLRLDVPEPWGANVNGGGGGGGGGGGVTQETL